MAEKTKLWYLQGINLFQGMDEKSIATLAAYSKMHATKKKKLSISLKNPPIPFTF